MLLVYESFTNALSSLKLNLFRSFLTILGIVIGVTSVIVIVAIMQGFSQSISSTFEGFGANSITVTAKNSIEFNLKGIFPKIYDKDYEDIRRRVNGIENITPLIQVNELGLAKYENQTTYTQVYATSNTYQDVYATYTNAGRFITAEDERTRRRVVVIGTKLIENLKLQGSPLNNYIQLGGEWFKVIGVLEHQGSIFGISKDDIAIIPYSTGKSVLGNIEAPDFTIQFNVSQMEDLSVVIDKVEKILRANHNIDTDALDDFEVKTSDQLMDSFNDITNMLTLVLASIVGVSLLVGGIGVMNIMLVSVTERTKEIGICKALGANRQFIIFQFLFESVTLTVFGGIIGVAFGYLISFVISLMPIFPEPVIPLWAVLVSLLFSALIGVIFGIMPAIKASKLSPIDALNYE